MNHSIIPRPRWLVIAERAFAINFVAFSFIMFSCWFPTGFSATISTLAYLFALPIFFYQIKFVYLSRFELAGLTLFGWLSLSVVWSDASVVDSLISLGEYRIYFIVPVLISVLVLNEQTQRWAFIAAMLGAFIALLTSYGLGFGWWKIEGAHLSLANRIYHGFIMSSFLMACLLIARETNGVVRLLAGAVALLVAYNVLNIETGRTGYLQVVFVLLTFAVLTFSKEKAVLAMVAAIALFVISYLSVDRFHDRVRSTVENVEKMIEHNDIHSSVGYRLEFYRGAVNVGFEYPLSGVGVGDVASTLQSRAEAGQIRVLTDNVHSEFLNMLMAGGLPAVLLFCIYVASIAYSGFVIRGQSFWLGDALIGLSVIVTVSALFNSTIKDYGEKHALIILTSLLGARLFLYRGFGTESHSAGIRRF